MITFKDLGVEPNIQQAIKEMGFECPMPVQEKVIPAMLQHKQDIVALAQTGTGKTAAYGLPIIQSLEPNQNLPQAVILCPTRELCLQIANDFNDYAKYSGNVNVLPVYGGSNIEVQIKALKKGVQIIVATPGRLIDLIERKAAKLSNIKTLVLDEADEMLNMGFLDSINTILSEIPQERRTLLFSATMPKEIAAIAAKYMHKPIEITIGSKNAGAENIKHIAFTVHARDKYLALKRIVDYYPNIYGIVFCRTKIETQEIANKLIEDGYNAEALHGDLSQVQRDYVMHKFRIGHISLLVATDVAARGLDVDNLTHVINYGLPDDIEIYTHRSGRTGRAGKTGISIVIVNLKEKNALKSIEKSIQKSFEFQQIPSGRAICEKQLFHFIDRMEKVEIDHVEIDSYLPVIYKKLQWLEKEEIIKRFVALEFNRFLEYYRDAMDINATETLTNKDGKMGQQKGRGRIADAGYVRLFINLGKTDGFFPSQLIDLVNKNTPGLKVGIGRIDLMRNFSFFEVEKHYVKEVIRALKDEKFKDRVINIDIAEEKPKEKGDKGENNFKKHNNSNEKTFRASKSSIDKGYKSDRKTKKRSSSDNFETKNKGKRKKR